jgi:hypothetical protein
MNKQEILKSAWQFVKTANIKLADALTLAWALASKKAESIYKIVFKKESDDTITERVLKNTVINSKGNLMFHSLNDEGTRSTKIHNIKSFQKA